MANESEPGVARLVAQLLVIFSCFTGSAYSQEITESSFERLSSNLIVAYRQTHDMLGPSQATTVNVFGDGRVELTLPPVHPTAGQFEMVLEEDELNALVAEIIEANLTPEVPTNQQGFTYISDSTQTRIILMVDSFTTSADSTTVMAGPMEIVESDLGMQATFDSTGEGRLAQLFSVEQTIIELLTDPRMTGQ